MTGGEKSQMVHIEFPLLSTKLLIFIKNIVEAQERDPKWYIFKFLSCASTFIFNKNL
jgi:hypothetical protein